MFLQKHYDDGLRLELSKGPNRVRVSLPSPEVVNNYYFWSFVISDGLEFRTMDKVQKFSDPERYTPSSEPFSIYLHRNISHKSYNLCLCLQNGLFLPGVSNNKLCALPSKALFIFYTSNSRLFKLQITFGENKLWNVSLSKDEEVRQKGGSRWIMTKWNQTTNRVSAPNLQFHETKVF
jgi:hypothetical protein